MTSTRRFMERTPKVSDIEKLTAFAAVVDTLKTTKSPKMKRTILAEAFKRHRFLFRLFELAMSPYIQFNGASSNIIDWKRPERGDSGLFEILHELEKQRVGPSLAGARMASILRRMIQPNKETFCRIMDKDMSGVVSLKTANKALKLAGMDPFPVFEIPPYNEVRLKDFHGKGSFIACKIPKYSDRMIVVAEGDGRALVFNESGDYLNNKDAEFLFSDYFGKACVLDGYYQSGRFYIVDHIPFSSFLKGRCPTELSTRLERARKTSIVCGHKVRFCKTVDLKSSDVRGFVLDSRGDNKITLLREDAIFLGSDEEGGSLIT